jgi:tetrahydromethanopterin S-methyltransferase subunit G
MEAVMMEGKVSSWNDDRLDQLNRRVDEGFAKVDKRFDRVDKRFERVEGEMKEGFAHVDKRFEQVASRDELRELKLASREDMGEVKAQLSRLNDRIDRLHYSLVAAAVALFVALLANGVLG